jgi:hypothetical protein
MLWHDGTAYGEISRNVRTDQADYLFGSTKWRFQRSLNACEVAYF